MSDRFHFDACDVANRFRALPSWLADRFLRDDEKVTWVCGPRFNPSWERYVTHPALALLALIFGAVGLAASRLIAEEWSEVTMITGFVAGAVVVGSIIVLALFSGYFTRLVVTDRRLAIFQGYEMCRAWDIDDLPRSLIRFGRPGGREANRAIDLDAVKAILGGASDKFAEAGKILAFGKQVHSIKSREDKLP